MNLDCSLLIFFLSLDSAYVGCYGDLINNGGRDLNGLKVWGNYNTGGTVDSCIQYCASKKFLYAGVQFG